MKLVRPLHRGTLSALPDLSDVPRKHVRYAHFIDFGVEVPGRLSVHEGLDTLPEVLKQTTGECMEAIKRQRGVWIRMIHLPEYILLGRHLTGNGT